jgi:hypothetical protein
MTTVAKLPAMSFGELAVRPDCSLDELSTVCLPCCFQMDIHTAATTVKEALLFSARLRLPASVTKEQVRQVCIAERKRGVATGISIQD